MLFRSNSSSLLSVDPSVELLSSESVATSRFYMLVATDSDDSSSTDGSTDSRDDELQVLDNPTVCRSARIQRNA